MNPICDAGHSDLVDEAKNTYEVGNVEDMQLQLFLKPLHHLNNSTCNSVAVALRPYRRAIVAVLQGCEIVCVDWLDDGY